VQAPFHRSLGLVGPLVTLVTIESMSEDSSGPRSTDYIGSKKCLRS
jgi:hypothetical protein